MRFVETLRSPSPGYPEELRFHHLECAADGIPLRMRSVLSSEEASRALDPDQHVQLAQRVERALASRVIEKPATSAEYEELLYLMGDQPEDTGPAQVFADWLQLRGDPRGELIALQLAKETVTGAGWEALEQRVNVHLERHPELVPSVGRARITWKRGFVHRLEIEDGTTLLAGTLEQWASQPSLRLLRELAISSWDEIGANLRPLPPTLTKLELRHTFAGALGHTSEVVLGAPKLRSLVIVGTTDLERLRHDGLVELSIAGPPAYHAKAIEELVELGVRLEQLKHEALPSLRRLSISIPPEYDDASTLDRACAGLAASDIFGKLAHLELSGRLGIDAAHAMARARSPHGKLESLRVHDTTTNISRELRAVLQKLCVELVEGSVDRVVRAPRATTAVVDSRERRVRNRFKPAWGIGRVIAEHEDRIEVDFEGVGVRVIRSPELLTDVID